MGGGLVERDSYRCFCSLERRPRDISCFVFHFRGGQCTFIDGWIEAPIRPGRCRFECSPRLRQLDFIPFHRSPPLSLTAIAEPNIVVMSHWSQFAGKFSNTLLIRASNRLLSRYHYISLLLNCRRLVGLYQKSKCWMQKKIGLKDDYCYYMILLIYD